MMGLLILVMAADFVQLWSKEDSVDRIGPDWVQPKCIVKQPRWQNLCSSN